MRAAGRLAVTFLVTATTIAAASVAFAAPGQVESSPSTPAAVGPEQDHWPAWAADVESLCAGLGLWDWIEPESLPPGGSNTVRLIILPASADDWPECAT